MRQWVKHEGWWDKQPLWEESGGQESTTSKPPINENTAYGQTSSKYSQRGWSLMEWGFAYPPQSALLETERYHVWLGHSKTTLMIQVFQRLFGDLEMWKCVPSSTRIRASKDYRHKFFCALWRNIYFRTVKQPYSIPLLPGISSVYVCTFTRAGTSFLINKKKLWSQLPHSGNLQWGMSGDIHTAHRIIRAHGFKQAAKCCSAHSFAWLTSWGGK